MAEDLRRVFIDELGHGLEFQDQGLFDQQVGKEFPQRRAILIVNGDRVLLANVETRFSQPIGKRVFIDLLNVAVTEEFVGCERNFANLCAQIEDLGFVHDPGILSLLALCGYSI